MGRVGLEPTTNDESCCNCYGFFSLCPCNNIRPARTCGFARSGGVGFAVDASVVRADASLQTFMDRDDDNDWPRPSGGSRPVKAYLAGLDAGAEPAFLLRKLTLIRNGDGSD
jgi:hypothetical protein